MTRAIYEVAYFLFLMRYALPLHVNEVSKYINRVRKPYTISEVFLCLKLCLHHSVKFEALHLSISISELAFFFENHILLYAKMLKPSRELDS